MEGNVIEVCVQWRDGEDIVRATGSVADLRQAFVEKRRQWDSTWNIDPGTLLVFDKEDGVQLSLRTPLQRLEEDGIETVFIAKRGIKRHLDDEEETEEDKVKALKELIESQKYDDAWAHFTKIVKTYKGNGEENDDLKCNPIKVKSTWQGEAGPKNLTRLLVEQCNTIDTNINAQVRKEMIRESGQEIDPVDDKADYREGRVVGIRLGSGCGKSHLLLEAPRLLQRPGIYVTYNLNQFLAVDRKHPRETVSLRILLRLAEVPHSECYQFLLSAFGEALVSVKVDLLRNFAVHQLSKYCGGSPSVIVGVDEIMMLKVEVLEDGKRRIDIDIVKQVLSELGLVAKTCAKSTDKLCHIFVTSLKEAPLYTSSGTAVIQWTPQAPDESAVELILQPYLKARRMEEVKPLLIAAAGFHFRSIVFAAQSLGEFGTPSVQGILGKVYARWKVRVSNNVITDIKNFIVADCKGIDTSKGEVENYLDHRQAAPPALICGAFGVMTHGDDRNYEADVHHPLFNLFNCEFAYVNDAKQLEQFGESYDLFRAELRLPVLSAKVNIHFPSTTTTQRQEEWFRELMYPSGLTRSTDSLFETVGGKSKNTVLSQAGISPSKQNYYSPGKSNHPFVDRGFLAKHVTDGELCFVLIQDKMNDEVSKAVKGLNKVGALLKAQHSNVEVLCILNVIGAGSKTQSQKGLNFPYVLVRDWELETFYTAHFAPVARFIRQRHEIGEKMRKETAVAEGQTATTLE